MLAFMRFLCSVLNIPFLSKCSDKFENVLFANPTYSLGFFPFLSIIFSFLFNSLKLFFIKLSELFSLLLSSFLF